MKREGFLLACILPAGLALLALFPWAASTGEYHYGQTLVCFDCHTMHFSETQGKGSDDPYGTGVPSNVPLTTGPNVNLLRVAGINNLCLSCHDGQTFAPDVLGANANSYVRQAGALNRVGSAAPYEEWKGHTLDLTTQPPGGSSNPTLTCKACHTTHGSRGAYRNLNGCPSSSGCISYSKDGTYASRDRTKDVWLKQWAKGDLGGNYSYDSVRFNEPNTGSSHYARFCAGCHGTFHGFVGDPDTIGGDPTTGGFLRHPNVVVNIGAINDGQHSSIAQYNAGKSRVHVMSNSTTDYLANAGIGTFTAADGLTPSCFTCHKAHGNQNPFALIFLDPNSSAVTEEGTQGVTPGQGMVNLCSQCHVQAN